MQSEDNRNLLLAIALSVIVMVGWNYFYGVPQLQQQRQAQQQNQQAPAVPGAPSVPGVPPAPGVSPAPGAGSAGIVSPGTAPAGAALPGSVTVSREVALERSPRVKIETPALRGSIALMGGRLDDLSLANYRETVERTSANIVLFAPVGAPNAYFADFGWVPAAGQTVAVPGPETRWQASGEALRPGNPVTLSWDNGQGLVFTRKFEIDERYLFTITDGIRNAGGAAVALANYGRITRHGTPATAGFYILHEGPIGYLGEKLQEPSYDTIRKARTQTFQGSTGGWLGITDKYWAAALLPPQQKVLNAAFTANGNEPVYEAAAIAEPTNVAPGTTGEAVMRLFAGAKEVSAVDGYAAALQVKNFDLMIDWGWFYWLTKPMFFVIDWVNKLAGNFGITILIVTVLIKLVFFPLANKSYESMAKMKAVQPEMLAIRDRFADDKMKQQQAMMELYKKEKINPLAGCLPVLIQIPVFFALYKVLFVTIEMRHAPFFGWIRDLAAPDPTNLFNLFGLVPFTPPSFFQLGIWPIIMGITMWLQMKMNPEPTDPIQKTVFGWMPILFTFMLATFPAGLVIYWAWNNLLSVTQQYVIMKKMGTKVELWDNIKGMFKKA